MKTFGKIGLGILALVGALSIGAPEAHAQSAYSLIQSSGSSLTKRRVINCTGALSCADDAAHLKTTMTIAGGGTTTLPAGYAAGAVNPTAILLTSTGGGILLQDAATPIGGTLFGVQSNAGAANFLTVSATAVTLGANEGLTGAAGTGALSLGSMTGATALPTGNLAWTGASTKTVSIVSTGSGSSITLTAGAASTWSTSAGALTLDSATALNLGTVSATSVVLGASTVVPSFPGGLTIAAAKAVDTTAAGALNIGPTNATSMVVGAAGYVPSFPGGLSIAAAKSVDTTSAGALNIGPTNATSIVEGSASVAPSFPGGLTIASAKAVDTTAGSGTLNIGPTNATTIGIGNSSATTTLTGAAAVTLGTSALTVASTAATARAGMRNANTRNIVRASSAAVPDCTGGTLTLTVTQFLDAGAATCGTAQTINFPTWQGASGIVQGLPGTPAVGDVVTFEVAASAASALTVGAGTGGTLAASATVPANTSKLFWCKLTSVTASSETATCY